MMKMLGHDIYIRHTNTDGKSWVAFHRVWDKSIFLATQQRDAEQSNQEAIGKGKSAQADVTQITFEQYRKEI